MAPTAGDQFKTYRGPEGIYEFFADAAAWNAVEGQADDILGFGDRVLLLGTIRWKSPPGSRLEVVEPAPAVLDFERDKLRCLRTYRTTTEALAAVGL